jgi:hypothetical protein
VEYSCGRILRPLSGARGFFDARNVAKPGDVATSAVCLDPASEGRKSAARLSLAAQGPLSRVDEIA